MRPRVLSIFAVAACIAIADAPAHVQAGPLQIEAEFLSRSIPTANGSYFTADYLVVEVLVTLPADPALAVSSGQFSLRLNGKTVLLSQSAGIVAASLKYPDWERRPQMTAQAGLGDRGVILGRPPAVGRFPGDPRPGQSRLPGGSTGPEESGAAAKLPVEEAVASAGFPDGPVRLSKKGCLFFPYRGKIKSIRKLELLYEGAPGVSAVLPLF